MNVEHRTLKEERRRGKVERRRIKGRRMKGESGELRRMGGAWL